MTARRTIPAVLLLLAALAAYAPAPLSRVAAQTAAVDPVLYSGMQWRSVGPATRGRTSTGSAR
jgi:hypothetical protein